MINPFKRSYTSRELSLFNFLYKIKIFEHLSQEELAMFLPYMYLRKYGRDEAVFFRNDPSHALYIISEGNLTLGVDVKDKTEVLGELEKGKAFGKNALIKNAKRPYNAFISSEEAQLYVIPHVNIQEIFSEKIGIKAKMFESLAEEYDQYFEEMFDSYRSSFGFFSLSETDIYL